MIRLLAFILVFAVFLAFIVLNLDNKCDVSFGFRTFKDIPVFLTAFSSFVVGMLFTGPFVLSLGRRQKKYSRENSPDTPLPSGGKKKRRPAKNKNSLQNGDNKDPEDKDGIFSGSDDGKKESSPYGID